ncbi:hypothetical protein COLO4_37677 [Corchorus olitorius]|uniref:GB1/RHD3-type G domain-containing protein n=1 Tax=Corchorus olitorius TaxID=93759 RepID=A0A1R3G038_9ROSI|nr:hypothetical protein COLO4_37677 [Corchorus olitorius]
MMIRTQTEPLDVNGKPMRFIYRDDNGKLKMNPEAVDALKRIKGPIGVVYVCGPACQGKSSILNQILGKSNGFKLASNGRHCTKGLWIWNAPLKRTAPDGTEYSVLLMDTEGIDAYDQTEKFSTQIFSLGVLLSSMFIYNQMGSINEASLDHLSLITEMTKLIQTRATCGKDIASELGHFSPIFVWLLRDFYLDLTENNTKVTPKDYLEKALKPVPCRGEEDTVKNKIRDSLRALFPVRECFTLVRPLNNESDLQHLDLISLEKFHPEFQSSLDALRKFVLERTRPKQVGGTTMTGTILAGLAKSFLDSLNNGAAPAILSSWQSVEELECRRAYDIAIEVYLSAFDRTKPAEEVSLREAHDEAVQKSVIAFNESAVGASSARQKYEGLLHNFFTKAFEDYKRNAFLEADLKCLNAIQSMEKKLIVACQVPDANTDHVVRIFDGLLSEYEASIHGPTKWKMLSSFLRKRCISPQEAKERLRTSHKQWCGMEEPPLYQRMQRAGYY